MLVFNSINNNFSLFVLSVFTNKFRKLNLLLTNRTQHRVFGGCLFTEFLDAVPMEEVVAASEFVLVGISDLLLAHQAFVDLAFSVYGALFLPSDVYHFELSDVVLALGLGDIFVVQARNSRRYPTIL